jgi:hypothetical protein
MSGLIMLALLSGCAEQLLGRNVDCTSYQQIELEGADSLEYNLGRSEHYAFDCFVAVRLAGSEEPGVRYNPDAGVVFLDGYAAPVLSAASAIPAVVGHGLPGGALITDYRGSLSGDIIGELEEISWLWYAPDERLELEAEGFALDGFTVDSAEITLGGLESDRSSWNVNNDFFSFSDVSISSPQGQGVKLDISTGGLSFDTLSLSAGDGAVIEAALDGSEYLLFSEVSLSVGARGSATLALPGGDYDIVIAEGLTAIEIGEGLNNINGHDRRVYLSSQGASISLTTTD